MFEIHSCRKGFHLYDTSNKLFLLYDLYTEKWDTKELAHFPEMKKILTFKNLDVSY
jgi:hypothetical protein